MKIAVLQQYPFQWYDVNKDTTTLSELKDRGQKTLDRCFELIDEAAKNGADLAVTMETVNAYLVLGDTRFRYTDTLKSETVKRFSKAAKKYKMHIVAGLALEIDGNPYN